MHINNEDLEEFIRLYEDEFKEYISREDALEMALRVVELYTLLAEPLPSERDGSMPPSEDLSPPSRL